MQNLKEIYYSSNLDPIPNPDLLFLSAEGLVLLGLHAKHGEVQGQEVQVGRGKGRRREGTEEGRPRTEEGGVVEGQEAEEALARVQHPGSGAEL